MMNKYFLLQIIVSFVIGGAFVTFLSFLAERIDKYSGIILTFPSTLTIGFFFLGMILGADKIITIIPVTLISLGSAILFAAIYFYAALLLKRANADKIYQIICSFCFSTMCWFALVFYFIMKKFSNLTLGIVSYLLLITITYVLLNLKNNNVTNIKVLKYSIGQKICRALFVGGLIATIVILSKSYALWGAAFAMFPAAIASTIMTFHWYYGIDKLLPVVKKMPIGSVSLFVYALVSIFSFRYFGFIFGTIVSCIVSLLTSILICYFRNGVAKWQLSPRQ